MTDDRGRYPPTVYDEQAAPVRHDPFSATLPLPPSLADGASFQAVLRVLRPIVGHAAVQNAGTAPLLERLQLRSDPPSVSTCDMVEAGGPRRVSAASESMVAAFLDGVHHSRLVGPVHGSPIVFGTVAAVIRERVARRLETWHTPTIERRLFVSRGRVGEGIWAELHASAIPIEDVGDQADDDSLLVHPLAARARALELVAHRRETIERALAAAWCAHERRWLWVDGGISGNLAIDEHATAFGVVKSHHTLYGDSAAVRSVLGLREGERSSAFLVTHRARRPVASWYLRLRDAANADPLHGLVRVEVAPPSSAASDAASHNAMAATADRLSTWILAERRPLSLPDARWDTLTYGVHGCETYLKALIGS